MKKNEVVVDTDILSMFAKAHALDALIQAFRFLKPVITPAIRAEITVPLQYGFTFPWDVLQHFETVELPQESMKMYMRFLERFTPVGRGELEAIAYCRETGALFSTNDRKAREFALNQGINVVSLQAILRSLWEVHGWTKGDVQRLLERLQKADRLLVSEEVRSEIFD